MAELPQALIVFGGITGFIYLGAELRLKRGGHTIPARVERAYVVFGCALITAIVISSIIRLLP